MRTKLNFLFVLAMVLVFPAVTLAHPGHAGHGFPSGMEPIGFTDILLSIGGATVVMGMLWGIGAAWRWWRSSN